jgi:hypothetical protein
MNSIGRRFSSFGRPQQPSAWESVQNQRARIRQRANDLQMANATFGNALVNANVGLSDGMSRIAVQRATDMIQTRLREAIAARANLLA